VNIQYDETYDFLISIGHWAISPAGVVHADAGTGNAQTQDSFNKERKKKDKHKVVDTLRDAGIASAAVSAGVLAPWGAIDGHYYLSKRKRRQKKLGKKAADASSSLTEREQRISSPKASAETHLPPHSQENISKSEAIFHAQEHQRFLEWNFAHKSEKVGFEKAVYDSTKHLPYIPDEEKERAKKRYDNAHAEFQQAHNALNGNTSPLLGATPEHESTSTQPTNKRQPIHQQKNTAYNEERHQFLKWDYAHKKARYELENKTWVEARAYPHIPEEAAVQAKERFLAAQEERKAAETALNQMTENFFAEL
jgi:hypothetical protein